MDIRRLLNENAKEDKVFIAFVKTVEKFASDMNINPTTESFLNILARTHEYFSDKDDEIDTDNDVIILSNKNKWDDYYVNLKYKGSKYVIALKGSTIQIFILNNNQYKLIYNESDEKDTMVTDFAYFIVKLLSFNIIKSYMKENNITFYNKTGIEKLLKSDKYFLYDLCKDISIANSEQSNNRNYDIEQSKVYQKYKDLLTFTTDSDLTIFDNKKRIPYGIFSLSNDSCLKYIDNKEYIYQAMVTAFLQWYNYAN